MRTIIRYILRNKYGIRVFTPFLIVLALILLIGCSGSDIRKTLLSYYSQKVVFPSSLTVITGASNDMRSIQDSIPKVVLFIDSTECSSCRIGRLIEYEDLAAESLRTGSFMMAIIISPLRKDFDYARHLLEQYDYPFPIYLDQSHCFRKDNAFIPDDIRFHAFFVDANNNPVLVGDPTRGKKIRQLFQQKLSEL